MQNSLLHIRFLLKRFGLAMLVFLLCRLVFFLFNAKVFAAYGFAQIAAGFFYGLLFDVSALVYLLSPFILLHILPLPWRRFPAYQLLLKIYFIIATAIAIALNLLDSEYYKFSGKRSGADLITGNNDIGALWQNYIIDYWFLIPLFACIVWLLVKYYPSLQPQQKHIKYNWRNYFLQTLYMVILAGLALIGARGGIGLKPIRPFDAARFVPVGLVPLTLNTPFQILSTIEGSYVSTPEYMPQAEAEKLFPTTHQYNYKDNLHRKNVVIIVLESFGKEYVGYFNNGEGYTPFLDSLCTKSLVCTQGYANGKRSSDAIPAIFASIPSLLDVAYINSVYSDTRTRTLGNYLQKEGYYSAFFHGARNGSMGFDNFLNLAGNGDYFGLNEYPDSKDFDGSWGIFDEPYLQYFAHKLDNTKQPFCTGIFTLSSHHPYPIPEKYKDKFADGSLQIHKSVRYTDYSLKQFFIYASRQKWFQNTLFVITADHSAENQKPFYQTTPGKFAVPILFYTPDGSLKGTLDKPVAHTDIMPSVLDYLHYSKPFFSFGKSAFRNEENGIAHFDNGLYQLIKDSVAFHFDGKNARVLYFYPKDSFLQQNKMEEYPALTQKYEQKTKALLQVFFSRLNGNGFFNKQ